MEISKKSRTYLAVLIGILSFVFNVSIIMGAFFVNDYLEPYLKTPGLYELDRKIAAEKDGEKRVLLGYEFKK